MLILIRDFTREFLCRDSGIEPGVRLGVEEDEGYFVSAAPLPSLPPGRRGWLLRLLLLHRPGRP